MTVYSSRRNIKRDRYCKRVIIIWRLRYRNTHACSSFLHSLFFIPPPPFFFLQSSLFIDLSHLVERINLQRRRDVRRECPSIIREIFEKYYLYCACIFFSYWRKCDVFVEARFASVSGTNHPRDERNTIFHPQAVKKPDLCFGINSPQRNLLATGWNGCARSREKFNKSARVPFFTDEQNSCRSHAREREREDDIISRWRSRCTVTRYDSNALLSPLSIGSRTR